MSYLVCEQCGKYYELNEGNASFNYDKCECGGKLSYTSKLNKSEDNQETNTRSKNICHGCGVTNTQDSVVCSNCGETLENKSENNKNGISWIGIAIGFGFLVLTTLLTVFIIFGNNIPVKASDIPYKLLIEFGIVAMVLSVISGFISAYTSGSIKFKDGTINGGLVGIILGILVGLTSGSITFLGVIAVFGSLTAIGGILGTFFKRRKKV